MADFDDLYREIEQEAQAEGPTAVAELRSRERYYSLWSEFIALRRRRQMTQAELARRSGIPQSEISRIERGSAKSDRVDAGRPGRCAWRRAAPGRARRPVRIAPLPPA